MRIRGEMCAREKKVVAKNDLGFVLSCSFINSGRVWV
jgi:hypothetical protein